MKRLIILFATISGLDACTIAAPELPALPPQHTGVCQVAPVAPIPERLSLIIAPEHIDADAGGEKLIREYIRIRREIEQCRKNSKH